MPIYAVGFKNWVELREADKAPKAIVSTASVKTEGGGGLGTPYFDREAGFVKYRKVSKVMKIKSIIFEGGKVLTAIPSSRFSYTLGMTLAAGKTMLLTPEWAKTLLDGDWSYTAMKTKR